MDRYRVKDPQGVQHVIEGPEGATPDQVLAQAQALIPSQPPAQEGISPQSASRQIAWDIANKMLPWNRLREATFGKAGEAVAEAGGRLGQPEIGAAVGTGVQMIPDFLASLSPAKTEGVPALRRGAESFGRRALGYNKGLIKRGGGVEEANRVARQMLDEGVITAGASPATMLERAEDLAQTSGQRIGETLASVDKPLLTTRGLRKEISSQLDPGKKGGEYSRLRSYVADIQRTVRAHAPKSKTTQQLQVEPGGLLKMQKVRTRPADELSFESAQELKQTLKGPAQFGKLTDGERSEMFRRAYGVVRKSIDTGLDDLVKSGVIPQEKAAQFLKDKASYGASQQAINALKDKLAGEAANNIISLRGALAGAGSIASGNLAGGMAGLGTFELLRRRGESAAASFLNRESQSRGINPFKLSILQEYLNRRRGKESR